MQVSLGIGFYFVFDLDSRELFGSAGRLVEIMSQEDQDFVVKLLRTVESGFVEPELSYWWTGLKDENDDRVWNWVGSKLYVEGNGGKNKKILRWKSC